MQSKQSTIESRVQARLTLDECQSPKDTQDPKPKTPELKHTGMSIGNKIISKAHGTDL